MTSTLVSSRVSRSYRARVLPSASATTRELPERQRTFVAHYFKRFRPHNTAYSSCGPLTAASFPSSSSSPQVEHLNLHEAQRRAREAGDPRPVADIMHRHTQQDYGWCRWAWGCGVLGWFVCVRARVVGGRASCTGTRSRTTAGAGGRGGVGCWGGLCVSEHVL